MTSCRCCQKPVPRTDKTVRVWWHLCPACKNAAKRYALGPGEDDAIGFISSFLNHFQYSFNGEFVTPPGEP